MGAESSHIACLDLVPMRNLNEIMALDVFVADLPFRDDTNIGHTGALVKPEFTRMESRSNH